MVQKHKQLLKKVAIETAAIGGAVVATVPLALGAVGFGAGRVATGSMFALAQSVGAAGLATSTVVRTVGGGAILGAAAAGVTAHLAEGKTYRSLQK